MDQNNKNKVTNEIIKYLDAIEDDESYKDVLSEITKYCGDELGKIKFNKYKQKVYEKLLESPFINSEFMSMYKCIEVIEKSCEKAGSYIISNKKIKIGNICFSVICEGHIATQEYSCEIYTSKTNVVICDNLDYGDFHYLKLRKEEDYWNDLLKIYKSQKFKTISLETFCEYVSYVISKIMRYK
jgi:hypothetical protein